MKKLSILIALISFSAVWAEPSFHFDFASFRAGEDVSLLQVYILAQRNSLEFRTEESELRADFTLEVVIKLNDSTVTSVSRNYTDCASSEDEIKPYHKIPQEISFHITPGDYEVEVSLKDNNSGDVSLREREIMVRGYPEGELALSDIEFASKIENAETAGHFVKNNVLVIPNAERIYGEGSMTAFYYAEIYNLAQGAGGEEHIISRTILDENRNIFKSLPERRVPAQYPSLIEVNLFSCATMPTGTYYLAIEVTDGVTGGKVEKDRRFWVYKADRPPEIKPVTTACDLENEIYFLTLEEAERELEYIRYIADKNERKIIKKLEYEGFKIFLRNFWKKKDESGVMRRDYLERVKLANERFTSLLQEGWKTDRGRVLIVFGEPDLVERKDFGVDEPDTQVWHYDRLEGGVVFVFVDMNATGDLRQVYSNMVGEFVDASWVKRMETNYWGVLQEIRSRR